MNSELPEWSMADIDDMENNFIGTFDSSGAFVSLKVIFVFYQIFSLRIYFTENL